MFQRLVYEQISSSGVKLHEYPIIKEMVKHCHQFPKRYQNYLTEKKDAAKESEGVQEINIINVEIKKCAESEI